MRHKCGEHGCWREKHCPPVEEFAGCFPRRISLGDVDYEVELDGCLLKVEFKGRNQPITRGQAIMYQRITDTGRHTVAVVRCDANPFVVHEVGWYRRGKFSGFAESSFDALYAQFSEWALMAEFGAFRQAELEHYGLPISRLA